LEHTIMLYILKDKLKEEQQSNRKIFYSWNDRQIHSVKDGKQTYTKCLDQTCF
jgi:hypothetical protein